MDQVAFSPSGRKVAYISPAENTLNVVDTETYSRVQATTDKASAYDLPSVVWSTNENTFYFKRKDGTNAFVAVIANEDALQIKPTSPTAPYDLLTVYGRVSTGTSWGGNGEWGQFYDLDRCNGLSIVVLPGFESALRVDNENATNPPQIAHFRINSGLLQLSAFYFQDVSFLPDCQEIIFDTAGYIYIWNHQQKQIGIITAGERFILLTDRYRKSLHTNYPPR
jgi:hypothetical protein